MGTPKQIQHIFVIMPFTETPKRNGAQLTDFFENHLKSPIEKARLKNKYVVSRSDDTLNINEQIIRDIYGADIAICDLSGITGNPNVMYELGLRLSLTDKPVILIREKHPNNQIIFDISGLFAFEYDPLTYSELTAHVIGKIKKFENNLETYRSPVLTIAAQEVPLLTKNSLKNATTLIDGIIMSVTTIRGLFARKLSAYLEKNNTGLQATNVDDLFTNLQKNSSIVNGLDWGGFDFLFSNQPSLDYYLANRYLIDLLDQEIEVRFYLFILSYHTHFLSTTYYHGAWHARAVSEFLGESNILILLSRAIKYIINEPGSAKKNSLMDAFNKTLYTSHLTGIPRNTPSTKQATKK